jgi:cell growth-regulating nucleolar protein
MRSWGSPAVVDDATEPFSSTPGVPATASAPSVNGSTADDKKKRKKKGDKGGTGSKANSKRPKEESGAGESTTDVTITTPVDATSGEPAAKKRKRTEEPASISASVTATSAELSDKTLKRLRKNASKVGEKASSALSLSEWLKQVGEGKKEQVDLNDVNRAAKVSFENGKWVLSF